MTDIIAYLKIFRSKSFFMRIFSCFLLISVCTSLFFTFCFSTSAARYELHNNLKPQIDSIKEIVTHTEYLFLENLQPSMMQVSYSQDVLGTVFSNEDLSTDYYSAATALALAKEYNSLISRIVLYNMKTDTVCTSEYTFSSLGDFPDNRFVYLYNSSSINTTSFENLGKTTSFFVYEGRCILATDFPLNGPHRLATLFFILDSTALYQHLSSFFPMDRIWIYDNYNIPIFNKLQFYPETMELDKIPGADDILSIDSASYPQYFKECSSATGLKFVSTLGNSSAVTIPEGLSKSIPLVLCLSLGIAIIFSFFFSFFIYRPLVASIAPILQGNGFEMPASPKSCKSELGLLNTSVLFLIQRCQKLQNALQAVSPDVLSRVMKSILSGQQSNYTSIKGTLKSIGSPLKVNNFYNVGILKYFSSQQNELPSPKMAAFFANFCKVSQEQYGCYCHFFSLSPLTDIIVCSFEESTPILHIKQQLTRISDDIQKKAEEFCPDSRFAFGRIYHSIFDIGFSYNEAMEKISRDFDSPPSLSNIQAGSETQVTDSTHDYSLYARHIFSYVIRGESANALSLSQRVLEGIFSEESVVSQSLDCYRQLIVSFLDNISTLQFIDETMIPNNIYNSLMELENQATPEETKNYACTSFLAIVQNAITMLKRQQHPTLLSAQDYIRKHYSDDSLSLSSVSSEVGVTTSHLSKLFNQNLNTRFTDYLNDYRVEQSALLLESTGLSVSEIAVKVGFATVQNYIRVFKKHFRETPGQYREHHKRCR